MKIMKNCILLTILGMCLGVGIVVGNTDEADGALNSAAEAPLKLIRGRKLTFHCNLTGLVDDVGEVEWRKDGEEDNVLQEDDTNKYKVFKDNNTLIIPEADPETDAGTYECRTMSPQKITKQFSVVFFSWKRLPKSLVVTEGETVEMKCLAEGEPKPTVQWYKDGQQLNDSKKYTYEPNEYSIANAELSFENAQQEDRGSYMCIIHTEFGQYNASTFLRVKSVYAPLYPLGGIVLEILLLIVVIIFFERRRAKQEYEESDTDQGPDMKNTSESHDSVRQRK